MVSFHFYPCIGEILYKRDKFRERVCTCIQVHTPVPIHMIITCAQEYTQMHGHRGTCFSLFPPCPNHSVPSPERLLGHVGICLLSGRERNIARALLVAELGPTKSPPLSTHLMEKLLPPSGLSLSAHLRAHAHTHTHHSRQAIALYLDSVSTVWSGPLGKEAKRG